MKEWLIKLPITTFIVVYFFICGSLYLIGFWSTFQIDVTNFISIMDIPKSFVFPLAVTTGFSIISILLNSITANYSKDVEEEEPVSSSKISFGRYFLKRFFSLDIFIVLAFLIAYFLIMNNPKAPTLWIAFGLGIASLICLKFIKSKIVKRYINSGELRLYVSYLLIACPIACFVIGKGLSLRIFNNDKVVYYQESTQYPPGNISKLKFIGFAGDKMILSTLNNQQIIIVNSDSKDQFVLVMD